MPRLQSLSCQEILQCCFSVDFGPGHSLCSSGGRACPKCHPAVPGATWLLAHVLFCLPLSRQFELQSQTSLKQSGGITSSCKCLCVPRRIQKGRLTRDLGIAVPSAPNLLLPLGKGLLRSSTEPWLGWQGPHLEPLSTGMLCPRAPSPGTGPVFQSPPGAVGEWQRDGFQH